ncbi:MAG: DNA-directed RNA polymerase subunit alpha [Actinobacteria bacterium]|jgi:DNA-directed RNA polymerase subunit alpha|nr:DNA-directed RNA polymerase subunit alpha [Actinomycetota bacterium]MCL6104692.1 DNA-directed RNA polymerase subunit alpha [Actinomycetota bacterium]
MLIIQRPRVEQLDEDHQYHMRFAVSPLEPGFGYTIGNSLRRTLLSSIPGVAVTQVRFDQVLHEFSTISGVKEDVSDIILNLKDLVVRMWQSEEEEMTLRCDIKGPKDVTAGDLELPTGVEIINPDLHIATLNTKAHLVMDVMVGRGRGYVSAEYNKPESHHSSAIGLIAVDSIFTPVRRAAFSVEPTRVEQSTDFDRLVLDIETDGSCTPKEALASAGYTLVSLFELISEVSKETKGLELQEVEEIGPSVSPDLALLIEDLDLSERPRNCLRRAQVQTIGQLIEYTASELLALNNFGQKSLDEVKQKLDERGLSLRQDRY